jgi:SAM-dependent methyltransferase
VGCGTGEQSLLAAHFLDELPDLSVGVEDKDKSRLTFFLGFRDGKGNQSLIGAFSLAPLSGEHKGKTRFTLGGIDLEKGQVIHGLNLFPKFPDESVELSDHHFTVVSVDIDAKSLICAARIMPFLAQNQQRLEFLFMPCDIRETAPQPHFNTVFACYLFHWLYDGLPAAVHNIASALKPGGHLVVLGECPIEYTESPFLEYASSIHGGREPKDVSLQEIVALCTKEGLRFVEEKEVEILTIDPKDRHPMFGVVFRKE